MRIVHLITHLRLGAGRAIVDLASEQARATRCDVIVGLADDAEGTWRSDPALVRELDEAGVATVPIGDFFHRDLATLGPAAQRLRAMLTQTRARVIVHAHTAMAAALGRWAGAAHVVMTCHGWNPARAPEYDLQDALAVSLADAVISPSTYWAERLRQLPGSPDVQVIPCGFDLSRYPLLQRMRPRTAPVRIVCVGELTSRKGQDLLIEAMPHIWRQNPDVELHFVGDGDLSEALRRRARVLDTRGRRITFRGHVAHPYAELADADVFCLPSRSDNQPVAIVEAMLAGLPIVATGVGGIPEMLARAGCGRVVAPGSGAALADALCDVTRNEHRALSSTSIREAARAEYEVGAVCQRTYAVYEDTIRRTSRSQTLAEAPACP